MSSKPSTSNEAIEHILGALPSLRAPSPDTGHIDDGVLLAYHRQDRREIDDARANAIDLHLAACRDCRDLLAGLAEPAPSLPIPLLPARRRSFTRVVAGGGIAAAAAVLVAVLTLPGQRTDHIDAIAPDYVVRSVRAGADVRGPEGESQKVLFVEPTTRFTVVLEPKRDLTSTAPIVRAFVSHEGGPLTKLPSEAVTVGSSGAVKIEGRAAELLGEAQGRYTLYVAIGGRADVLDTLAGRTPDGARTLVPAARWVTVDIEARSAR